MSLRNTIRHYLSVPKSLYLCMVDHTKQFPDEFSVVCIAKYEAPYIEEWIRYYLCQGFDRIYIYDNESPDRMDEVLAPYIDSGRVVYTWFPGKARQLDAYNDALQRFKNKTRYMAFLDMDEFLVQEDPTISLPAILRKLLKKRLFCGGLAVNWRVFGSSGFESKPDGYVIENFLFRSANDGKGNDCIKTVANPRLIRSFNHVHYPTYFDGLYNIDENGKAVYGWSNPVEETHHIRINHYFTKSKEEWILRRSRGKADTVDESDKRTMEEFYEHDKNDIRDEIMLPYAAKMKEIS